MNTKTALCLLGLAGMAAAPLSVQAQEIAGCPPCDCSSPYPAAAGSWQPFWPPMPPGMWQGTAPGLGEMPSAAPARERMPQSMYIVRNTTPEGYEIKIHLQGQTPAALQIHTQGRTVYIQNAHAENSGQPGDGAYWRGFSFQQAQRWVMLPPDADMRNLSRSDGEGVIVLKIPRAR